MAKRFAPAKLGEKLGEILAGRPAKIRKTDKEQPLSFYKAAAKSMRPLAPPIRD